MEKRTGEEVRNEEHRENDSEEQEEKIAKGQDVEPQAEEWNRKTSDEEDKVH